MRNLLFLTHRLPFPPNKGDKVRSYHLLIALVRRYRVFLGTFIDDPRDEEHVEALRGLCAELKTRPLRGVTAKIRSVTGLLTGDALTVPYYRDRRLMSWVARTIEEQRIDTVLVFSSAMAQYVEGLRDLRVFVDFVDVDSMKWSQYAASRPWPLSWLYRREAKKLLAYERLVALQARRSFFVTAAETALFAALAPECRDKVEAVSNGVDAAYFSPDDLRPSPYTPEKIPLVFTGVMDYWPNVDAVRWFASAIFPILRMRWPRLCLYIVGMRPGSDVRALAGDAVVVTGSVPDVRPYLQHAAVAVAPLRIARGIQNKVLEAMAMARPVVTSQDCAEAIDGATENVLARAHTAAEYAHVLDSLLADPQRAAAMGAAARRFVMDQYSWEQRLAPITACLQQVRDRASQRQATTATL